jgi:hypothetical protein
VSDRRYMHTEEEMEQRRQEVREALVPTALLRAFEDRLSDEAKNWLYTRPGEARCLDAFVVRMAEELAANSHKGDRDGWLNAGSRLMVSEVLYHAAKLAYALRQYEQGDGDADQVREFAADVANCSLMVADCGGVLE